MRAAKDYVMEVLILILLSVAALMWRSKVLQNERKKLRKEIEGLVSEAADFVSKNFMVKSCGRCHENHMYLLSVSPNARSIEYQCGSCQKKARAIACTPKAAKALDYDRNLKNKVTYFNRKFQAFSINVLCGFYSPEVSMPHEQTVREPITEAIRSEVWRRDCGKCVKCGSKQNLEFDHIIPVSKGGATSVRNIQLLCKPCNLTKGAKI